GWTGPWATRRGFDSLVQMSSGIAEAGMHAKRADKPVPLPVQALDHGTGYIMAAGVMRGLYERATTGRGLRQRYSLARTAALLARFRAIDGFAEKLTPETQDDLAREIEETSWGPARRLEPPLTVYGAPMRWDIPAGEHGRHEAVWG
ncbi:MAG: CoA transferase, partial [Beijerinckiaceae bacterium]